MTKAEMLAALEKGRWPSFVREMGLIDFTTTAGTIEIKEVRREHLTPLIRALNALGLDVGSGGDGQRGAHRRYVQPVYGVHQYLSDLETGFGSRSGHSGGRKVGPSRSRRRPNGASNHPLHESDASRIPRGQRNSLSHSRGLGLAGSVYQAE